MWTFIEELFSSDYMPHGYCYRWDPIVLWLSVVSDAIIFLAYFSIPIALIYFIKQRKDLAFNWILFLFACFIFACGITHLMEVWTVWHGTYRLSALMKFITAMISIFTAILLWPLIPKALKVASEEELRAVNTFLDSVIENIPSMIFLKEAENLTFVRFNKAGEELLGLTREELQGKCDYDFFPKDQADFFTAKDRAVLQQLDCSESIDEPIATKTKGLRYLTTKKIALRDETGKPTFLLGISEDVTEQKRVWEELETAQANLEQMVDARTAELQAVNQQLERQIAEHQQAELRFQLAVESAPNAMILVNQDGEISLVNAETERLFQYPRTELLGKKIELLIPLRFRLGHPDVRTQYFASPEARAMGVGRELYGLRKDGTEFPVEIGLNPISTPTGRYVLGAIVDISQRRQAETTLRQHAAELERSNQELDQFAYVASHDLKSPLRAIANLASWIDADIGENASGETKEHLSLLKSRVQRMERLLDSLLEYSRIGRTQHGIEDIDTQEMIREIIEFLAPPNSFTIKIDKGLPVVRSRRVPLELVFRNIIGNAVKHHSSEAGTLEISAKNGDDFVEFAFSDNGPGIPPEYHTQIFEMFRTLKSRDEVEGSGMGLAIVQKTVELHGGSVSLQSKIGVGTTFNVKWPKAAKTELEMCIPMENLTVNILLIEDDRIDVEAFRRALLNEHIANPVYTASDGIEALSLLRGEGGRSIPHPYLIMLDINMPRMNGIQFLEELRRDPRLHTTLVFILTTSDNEKDKIAAYNQHVAGYLLKSDIAGGFLKAVRMLKRFVIAVQFPDND